MTFRLLLQTVLHPTKVVRDLGDAPTLQHPPVSLHGSLQVRHVDAGSCNGCELEVTSAFAPVYDAERFGVRLVASPRHADALLVTGPVTKNMAAPLRKTLDAMPEPRLVAALGDCALGRNLLGQPDEHASALEQILAVDLRIPGCPPHPAVIAAALIGAIEQRARHA